MTIKILGWKFPLECLQVKEACFYINWFRNINFSYTCLINDIIKQTEQGDKLPPTPGFDLMRATLTQIPGGNALREFVGPTEN